MRYVWLGKALTYIPRIIQLCDTNPLSRTYGCFDRSYWHYKTIDFPSGMYQEYILPLAIVYCLKANNNRWYKEIRLKELCKAGVLYSIKAANSDGSCDDYYPFERALGATSFALYSATETFKILNLDSHTIIDGLKERGNFILKHNESGKLSNHQALCGLALYNLFNITKEKKYLDGAIERVKTCLSWQNKEGWFYEYEGCDPGYLTATISFLAKYYFLSSDEHVLQSLRQAVSFASNFIQPDGSYGGEYGSRNSYHYYPHGFELLAKECPEAPFMNDLYAKGISNYKHHCNDDDRIFCHLVYDYLQAYIDYAHRTNQNQYKKTFKSIFFKNAGIYIKENPKYKAIINYYKGGVIKVHNNKKCLLSDTGPAIKYNNDKIAVIHMIQKNNIIFKDNNILQINGICHLSKSNYLTPWKFIIFRLLVLSIAYFNSNLFRILLQRILITYKKPSPFKFTRTLAFYDNYFSVEDKLEAQKKHNIKKIFIGSNQTSIYTAVGNSYQESILHPWHEVSEDKVQELKDYGKCIIKRVFNA